LDDSNPGTPTSVLLATHPVTVRIMSTLVFATRSDLTPRQGNALDMLPGGWTVIGRVDSDAAATMSMQPDPYTSPPTLLLVRDPNGHTHQIDRDGNLSQHHRRYIRQRHLALVA
jgi:hypothetical protein